MAPYYKTLNFCNNVKWNVFYSTVLLFLSMSLGLGIDCKTVSTKRIKNEENMIHSLVTQFSKQIIFTVFTYKNNKKS